MVKLDYRTYDKLIGLIHRVPQENNHIGTFLTELRAALNAATASLALCDESQSMIAFGMCAQNYPMTAANFVKTNRDTRLMRFGQRNFQRAVRLSDLACYEDLVKHEWYRASFVRKGLRHSLCQDMAIGPLTLRVIACREQSLSDFDGDDVEFFERVQAHVQVAVRHFQPDAFVEAWRSASVRVFDLRETEGAVKTPIAKDILRDVYGLSPAEVKVAMALAQGASCVDTAAALNRSVDTVRSHLKKIHLKLRVSRRGELMRTLLAIQDGKSRPKLSNLA